ncbi:MAG: diguanylate cyclase domain-containing protein [Gammaproteobacteria bacterium]
MSGSEAAKRPVGRALAMRLLRSTRPESLRQRLGAIRADIIDRLWLSLFIVAVVGAPLSALRAGTTGWLPIYSLHLALGALISVVFFIRKRLRTTFKLSMIVAVFWVIGLAGLGSTGMVGPSVWWLSLSILLITALYSPRAGLLTALLTVAVTSVAAAGFIQGWLTMPYDTNVYIRTVVAWANVVVAAVLLPLLLFSSVTSFHHSTVELLEEVDAQRELIRQLATHDELTGVPTLRLATDRLEQALLGAARAGGKVAVLFIDLDGFKAINDTHGHEAGDAVLKSVAQRCRNVLRAEDTVARKGGDEFIAILHGIEGPAAALALAQRIIDTLSVPVNYLGQPLRAGASIGVAVFPEHALTAVDMIRAGDVAMYEAKRAGANQARVAVPLAPQASA